MSAVAVVVIVIDETIVAACVGDGLVMTPLELLCCRAFAIEGGNRLFMVGAKGWSPFGHLAVPWVQAIRQPA